MRTMGLFCAPLISNLVKLTRSGRIGVKTTVLHVDFLLQTNSQNPDHKSCGNIFQAIHNTIIKRMFSEQTIGQGGNAPSQSIFNSMKNVMASELLLLLWSSITRFKSSCYEYKLQDN